MEIQGSFKHLLETFVIKQEQDTQSTVCLPLLPDSNSSENESEFGKGVPSMQPDLGLNLADKRQHAGQSSNQPYSGASSLNIQSGKSSLVKQQPPKLKLIVFQPIEKVPAHVKQPIIIKPEDPPPIKQPVVIGCKDPPHIKQPIVIQPKEPTHIQQPKMIKVNEPPSIKQRRVTQHTDPPCTKQPIVIKPQDPLEVKCENNLFSAEMNTMQPGPTVQGCKDGLGYVDQVSAQEPSSSNEGELISPDQSQMLPMGKLLGE
jgi:hypothetical protein